MAELSEMINKDDGIINPGNWGRLISVMKRAMAGDDIVLGFIGGSITQGAAATAPELCYAHRVYDWWKRTFPGAGFTYVNAGIGATTSEFGAARADEDLLAYGPDFVIIEFSVNDECNEHFMETYEGTVRKIYGNEKSPAVILVHNARYDGKETAQIVHARVGRHYDLPAVSMQSSIYPEVLSGRIQRRLITPDDLHPNDAGHELVAEVICSMLERALAAIDELMEAEKPMPSPLTPNRYENSVRYQNDSIHPALSGFKADTAEKEGITDIFKKGWMAEAEGDSITFDIECKGLAIQYRKTPEHPAPVGRVVADGDEENAVILDANFDEDWGDLLALEAVIRPGEQRRHRVEVSIKEAHPDDKKPFYLASLIAVR